MTKEGRVRGGRKGVARPTKVDLSERQTKPKINHGETGPQGKEKVFRRGCT